jgi:hypothetical protein
MTKKIDFRTLSIPLMVPIFVRSKDKEPSTVGGCADRSSMINANAGMAQMVMAPTANRLALFSALYTTYAVVPFTVNVPA